jgi:hypothetical protein
MGIVPYPILALVTMRLSCLDGRKGILDDTP